MLGLEALEQVEGLLLGGFRDGHGAAVGRDEDDGWKGMDEGGPEAAEENKGALEPCDKPAVHTREMQSTAENRFVTC